MTIHLNTSALRSPVDPSELGEALKGLGLTSLARAVPAVLETARQQQWAYETFLQQALGTEVAGRAQRAYERRVRAARARGPPTGE